MELPLTDDYHSLFLQDQPLLDVRAPVEFQQGAFPHASNIPLMNNEERRDVGIRYKELGQDKAIELGHQLVSGQTKEQRVAQWAQFVSRHPQGALYCFRGGMRSKISQQWIYEQTGVHFPRVKGGYKAMRRYLIEQLDSCNQRIQPLILGGRTGVGKTLLLPKIPKHIDLEGIYQHRGSAFGKRVREQPGQIDIENTLAIALIKHLHHKGEKLVLEDEAAAIGSRRLPESLITRMKSAPVVLVEADISQRVENIFVEYIEQALREHQQLAGEQQGFNNWSEQLKTALTKIQRRLGGQRHQHIASLMDEALQLHMQGNNCKHRVWIERLLVDYYDPMYDYQLEKKQQRIIFQGRHRDVLDYLQNALD